MIKRFILPALVLSFTIAANAQPIREGYGGIGFHVGRSIATKAGDRSGVVAGWNCQFAFPIKNGPFDWGFGFDKEVLEVERRAVTLRFPDFQTFLSKPAVPP